MSSFICTTVPPDIVLNYDGVDIGAALLATRSVAGAGLNVDLLYGFWTFVTGKMCVAAW